MTAAANLMAYLWPGIIAAQAIHVAAKLRIPDPLAPGPRDCGANPPTLERLLRAPTRHSAKCCGVIVSGHCAILRCFCRSVSLASAGRLYESARTGDPVFERIFGQRFFEYLASHSADAATFNAGMTQGIAWTSSPALLAAYDFSRFRRLVDVGGDEGALLREILAAAPNLQGAPVDPLDVVGRASGRHSRLAE